MENWKLLFDLKYKKVIGELKQEYKTVIGKAGKKEYVHNKLQLKAQLKWESIVKKTSANIGKNTNLPYKRLISELYSEIKNMHNLDKTPFNDAFEQKTNDYTFKKKKIIIYQIAEREAHINYLHKYLPEQLNEIKKRKIIDRETKQNNEPEIEKKDENNSNPEFTTRRQVLAIHYLLKVANCKNNITTEKTRFSQFITGKEANTIKIKDTYIYKIVAKPLSQSDMRVIQDLRFIRNFFENMGTKSVIDEINKEISSRE